MTTRPPILNQAKADASGFTLFARPDPLIWKALAVPMYGSAIGSLLAVENPPLAGFFLVMVLLFACPLMWFHRARYQFHVSVPDGRISVTEVVGYQPIKLWQSSVNSLSHVVFGPCENGRQTVEFIWKDKDKDPIKAILMSGGQNESDLSKRIRSNLLQLHITIL